MTTRKLIGAIALAAAAVAQGISAQIIAIEPSKLEAKNVKVESVRFKGRKAVRIVDSASNDTPDGERVAVLRGIEFESGVIEIDLAGDTVPGAPPYFRGFVGMAFRMSADKSKYEAFYLRPKNGRSDDQLQRNHSAQYISEPDFPWQRLRQETPGKYETYVDLVPGDWVKVRIEVRGERARFFVHGFEQPTLVVNDLKHGQSKGSIALWIGPRTVAHFSNLRIIREWTH